MRLLLPLLVVLAACGPEPEKKKAAPAVLQDAQFIRVQTDIRQVRLDIDQYYAMHGEWPDELPRARRDPWGTEYAYEIEDGRPAIYCAGADREFGTDDDISG
jgi:hypothetical protein